MRKQLLVCFQLEKISLFPKTNKRFYRCKSIPLFFGIYTREAYFHDDIKSMMNISWQTAAAVANSTKEKCMNTQV